MTTDSQQTQVACPGCGTGSFVQPGARDSQAFCRVCDYPLFWAQERITAPAGSESGDESLRRLPGTGGRTSLASLTCPVCTEPNAPSATICRRCGSDLHPKAVVVPPPPPPPVVVPPEPVVEPETRYWPWILAAVLAVLAIAAIVLLLVYAD